MPVAVRTIGAAGVTVLAASLIAASPVGAAISPTSRDVHLAAATAVIKPADFYRRIVEATADNVGELWQSFSAQPFPIAQVVVSNQAAFVSDLVETVAGVLRGEYPVTQVLTPIGDAVATASRNLVTVTVGVVAALPALAFSFVPAVVSTLVSAAFAVADMVRAVADLDVVGLVDAIVNVPGWIVNGFLNGTVIPNEAVPLSIPGFLASKVGYLPAGPPATVIDQTQLVAEQMSRYPTAAPAEPDTGSVDEADVNPDAASAPPGEGGDDVATADTGAPVDSTPVDEDVAPANDDPPETSTADTSSDEAAVADQQDTTASEDDPEDVSTRRAAESTQTPAAAATPEESPPSSPAARTE